jgi:flagellar biosynthesis protein FlhG
MEWEQARKLVRLASRQSPDGQRSVSALEVDPFAQVRAGSICVVSGKGGTGKSVLSASLGVLLARRARTLLVDADFGVGNAHILQDVAPERSFIDVVEGEAQARDIRVNCGPRLDLLAGGSGVSHMASLGAYELHLIACGIEVLELEYGQVLVDSAAGISSQTVSFAAASDVVLIVTTPDVTALTDAYAFLKVLLQRRGDCTPLLAVNRTLDAAEAEHVAERMTAVSRRFLGREPRYVGHLPEDRAVVQSVNDRRPIAISEPDSRFARALRRVAAEVVDELDRVQHRGLGRTLLRTVGYSPGLAP